MEEVFLIETVWQQFLQIGTALVLETLENSSTAAGVSIIVEEGIVVPLTAIAMLMGPTVSPVGTAMFAPTET
jgi:hypothetical protein